MHGICCHNTLFTLSCVFLPCLSVVILRTCSQHRFHDTPTCLRWLKRSEKSHGHHVIPSRYHLCVSKLWLACSPMQDQILFKFVGTCRKSKGVCNFEGNAGPRLALFELDLLSCEQRSGEQLSAEGSSFSTKKSLAPASAVEQSVFDRLELFTTGDCRNPYAMMGTCALSDSVDDGAGKDNHFFF